MRIDTAVKQLQELIVDRNGRGRGRADQRRRRNGRYNANWSDVPVAYSAQVSFRDYDVD